jgi:hypothetical protein
VRDALLEERGVAALSDLLSSQCQAMNSKDIFIVTGLIGRQLLPLKLFP